MRFFISQSVLQGAVIQGIGVRCHLPPSTRSLSSNRQFLEFQADITV
jgi:hypothetical protein